jgi:hypothetical protein
MYADCGLPTAYCLLPTAYCLLIRNLRNLRMALRLSRNLAEENLGDVIDFLIEPLQFLYRFVQWGRDDAVAA